MIQFKLETAVKFNIILMRSELAEFPDEAAKVYVSILAAHKGPVELTSLHPLIRWWVMLENLKNSKDDNYQQITEPVFVL